MLSGFWSPTPLLSKIFSFCFFFFWSFYSCDGYLPEARDRKDSLVAVVIRGGPLGCNHRRGLGKRVFIQIRLEAQFYQGLHCFPFRPRLFTHWTTAKSNCSDFGIFTAIISGFQIVRNLPYTSSMSAAVVLCARATRHLPIPAYQHFSEVLGFSGDEEGLWS